MNQQEFAEMIENLKEYSNAAGKALTREDIEREFQGMELAPEQVELIYEYFQGQERKEEKNFSVMSLEKEEELRREDERFYREYRQSLEAQWPGLIYLEALEGEAHRQFEQDFHETAGSGDEMPLFLTAVLDWVKPYTGKGLPAADLVQEANLKGLEILGDETWAKRLKDCGRNLFQELQEKVQAHLQDYAAKQRQAMTQEQQMLEKVNQVQDCARKLSQELGRKVQVAEVAQALRREEREIQEILAYADSKVENIC